MEKYRKKPIVIEAQQWFEGMKIDGVTHSVVPGEALVKTLEGEMRVISGDWIIKGIAGEYYPCKDEIFRKTYEKVQDKE